LRTLSPAFAAHLAGGATTLCWCWRLERRDGSVQGFTDHDRDLAFDGVTYHAASGFTASDLDGGLGLAVDNLEVEGALNADSLAESDLAAGLYDDARIDIYRVNWADPTERLHVRRGSLGEIRRTETAFVAEVRGLTHYLQQPKGRLFQHTCDADLGDARCGVDVSDPARRATANVTVVLSDRSFRVGGLAAFERRWFDRGTARFLSGSADGFASEIIRHEISASFAAIELRHAAPRPVAVGDTIQVTAGCDKHLDTCRSKFANAINFRGFPHMPGNDFVLRVARPGG
jgi:uncharacterized phage protein (TIGR02218 family)